MSDDDDRLIIQAAALLRGDLPDQRPDTFETLDAAFDRAMEQDNPVAAASLIRETADAAHLGARLHTFERELSSGEIAGYHTITRDVVFSELPGDPGLGVATVWTCPQSPPGHFRRRQRTTGQHMGVCTKHRVPLVREVPAG